MFPHRPFAIRVSPGEHLSAHPLSLDGNRPTSENARLRMERELLERDVAFWVGESNE